MSIKIITTELDNTTTEIDNITTEIDNTTSEIYNITTEIDNIIPNRVFIVPYRNREEHKNKFSKNMKLLLEDIKEPYEIYFAHQCDNRPFNRGAIKNLGFIAMRDKYPNHYKNITFIFNDVDTWPSKKGLIDYTTRNGVVKHYFGFRFALGGIFAIKGEDFEKIKGFPNFWGWGLEDNTLNNRCIENGITIDRSIFYEFNDKRIINVHVSPIRTQSHYDIIVYNSKKHDSLEDLKNIKMELNNEFINITGFDCKMKPENQRYAPLDVKKSNGKIPNILNKQRIYPKFISTKR